MRQDEFTADAKNAEKKQKALDTPAKLPVGQVYDLGFTPAKKNVG